MNKQVIMKRVDDEDDDVDESWLPEPAKGEHTAAFALAIERTRLAMPHLEGKERLAHAFNGLSWAQQTGVIHENDGEALAGAEKRVHPAVAALEKKLAETEAELAALGKPKMKMTDFAKILVEKGEACGLHRQDYDAEITKRSAAIKRPGESDAQAFTRYIVDDPDGRLLFKASKAAPVEYDAAQDRAPRRDTPEPAGPASIQMNALAVAEQQRRRIANELAGVAREKGASFAQSYAHVTTRPENRELAGKVKAEEMRVRSPIAAAHNAHSRG